MSRIHDLAEKIQSGEIEDGDLEGLTPEEITALEKLSFDAEEAADEITGGDVADESDDEGGEIVAAP